MDERNAMFNEAMRVLTDGMAEMDRGSKEFANAAKALGELYKAGVEEDKIRVEEEKNTAESKREKVFGIVKLILEGLGGIALPAVCFIVGLKFEESGSVSSFFNRQTLPNLFRRKSK